MVCFCGRFLKKDKIYCSEKCENEKNIFDSKPFKEFCSYEAAGEYFNLDPRIIKKYEGIKYSINPNNKTPSGKRKITKLVYKNNCKGCLQNKQCRKDSYCAECTKNNIGRLNQAKIISEKYKGEGNPNYVDGKGVDRNLIRGKAKYKKFVKENKKSYCEITGFTSNLELHHILPISLFPEFVYNSSNVITLCSNLHYEIHKQKLDIEFIKSNKYTKEEFISFIREKITIERSESINHYDFLKILVKNYTSYFTEEEISLFKKRNNLLSSSI